MTETHEHFEYETVTEYISGLDIIDNKKISYGMSRLHELYGHMNKRIGRPDALNFAEDSIEGSIAINISMSIPPYSVYRESDIKTPKIVGIGLHVQLLHRKHQNDPVQWFSTLDGFLNQIENWYNYEMSLPILEEK